jgi:hypothetical protein
MPAKDVRKIKTTYRAAQWTGTEESADDIRDVLDGTDAYGYFDTESRYGSFADINLTGKKGERIDKVLNVGYWVVSSSTGKVEVLSEGDYTSKYEDND